MDFRVLALDEERDLWDAALAQVRPELRDVYFESGYALVWQRHGDGRAYGAIGTEAGARFLYPFLVRELTDVPGLGAAAEGLVDLATPYGYGGILADVASDDPGPIARFRSAFGGWCEQRGVVSEFIRFHPLLVTQRGLAPHLDVAEVSETVVCPLGAGPDEILAAMDPAHRRGLRKAQRSGLVARADLGDEAYEAFRRLYTETMERRSALSSYFFDEAYFRSFRELLGAQQSLIGVFLGDEMVAGGLMMRSGRWAHYHLGGSSARHLDLRPNNLFFYEAMLWARDRGVEALHLGGGYRGDDDLLRFKRGFGAGRGVFAVGRAVHRRADYERLAALHRERVGRTVEGYFPAYRAPAAAGDGH